MAEDRETTAYVTKYALTTGAKCVKAVVCASVSDRMISYKHGGYKLTAHKPHWHETKEEAAAQVRKMIEARKNALRKALKKLDEMVVEIPDGH